MSRNNGSTLATVRSHLMLAAGVAWALVTSSLVIQSQTVGSPDEAANRFFIQHYARTGQLTANSGMTADQTQYWHPRSVMVDGAQVKPASFLGLVLVGGVVDRLWDGGSRLLTPLLALVGLWALYQIFRRFWSPAWSFLASSLVAFHPVWFQFQTLPYFHNGAFAALLLVAGWRLMKLWDAGNVRNALWFGLAYGATLFLRPVEVLWTGPLVAIVLLAARRWQWLLIAGVITLVMQIPWLLANEQLYGSFLGSGYAPTGGADLITAGVDGQTGTPRLITPPGGWSWHWLSSTWFYLILLVPTWSLATAIAFWFYLRRISSRPLKLLKISLVLLGLVFFLVFYGSWNLYPLESPANVGSLASYARYWLPLYVAMVVGLVWVLRRLASSKIILFTVVTALFVSQVAAVIWHPNAGVLARLDHNRVNTEKRQHVLAVTPANAAIIAGHMDKVLWPDRIVAFSLPTGQIQWTTLVSAVEKRTVYLYVTPRQYDREKLNDELQPYGLTIDTAIPVGGDQLWRLERL